MITRSIFATVLNNANAGKGVSLDWIEVQRMERLFRTLTPDQKKLLGGK